MAYQLQSTSVTSATVPVSLMPPGNKVSYMIKVRNAAAVPVLLFPYSGTLPGSAPANVFELAPGQFFSDEDPISAYLTDAMGQGWAAVLESGVTAVAVDAAWR